MQDIQVSGNKNQIDDKVTSHFLHLEPQCLLGGVCVWNRESYPKAG